MLKQKLMIKQDLKIVAITAGVLLLVLFGTPLLFGYKLAFIKEYTLDLDSMEQVSSILFGFLGTTATIIAIFVAVQIPKKIAEQQNRIALFERRYELYNTLQAVHRYVGTINEIKNAPYMDLIEAFCYTLWKKRFYIKVDINNTTNGVDSNPDSNEILSIQYEYRKQLNTLKSWEFLFPKIETEKELTNFIRSYEKCMDTVLIYILTRKSATDEMEDLINRYNILVEKDVMGQMRKELRLEDFQ